MSDQSQAQSADLTLVQKAGILVFVFLCGIPALEMNGFGFGIPFTLGSALACATIGGSVGGAMMCSRPIIAGLVGGLIAGPLGLLAVYFYTQHRETVYNMELVIVQGLACLPGAGVGHFMKKFLSETPSEAAQDEELQD